MYPFCMSIKHPYVHSAWHKHIPFEAMRQWMINYFVTRGEDIPAKVCEITELKHNIYFASS